jgi:hypothetical protein
MVMQLYDGDWPGEQRRVGLFMYAWFRLSRGVSVCLSVCLSRGLKTVTEYLLTCLTGRDRNCYGRSGCLDMSKRSTSFGAAGMWALVFG